MSAQDLSSPIIDRVVAFTSATLNGRRVPDLDGFLPPLGDPTRALAVRELARTSVQLMWKRGLVPRVEDYFSRYPELADPAAREAVAFEDYQQRLTFGNRLSRDSYRDRFGVDVSRWPSPDAITAKRGDTSVAPAKIIPPDHPTEQFQTRDIAPNVDASPIVATPEKGAAKRQMPEEGQEFAGFRLIRELGRGAFGRVFLAEQTDLAGREVALKIAVSLGGEVRTLARLQHTNIVPVHSLHQSPPFSALCMPYFGRTTLSAVLTEVVEGTKPTSGRLFAEHIERVRSAPLIGPKPSAIAFLDHSTYEDAVIWIGERIADALAHAHERGIIHRDIKPPNILLADDGQPMLLDFNLADDHNEVGAERAQMGGTLPYMAPEQMRAFGKGPKNLDGRVDIYGLGIVLYQLLTRVFPFPMPLGAARLVLAKIVAERVGPPPFLRVHNSAVSHSLEAIVRKCLEPNPGDRYPNAAALRDDLARQRMHLPLRGVREPSVRERIQKWKRRHPRLVSPSAYLAYGAAALLIAASVTVHFSLEARAKQQDADRAEAYRNYEELLALSDEVRTAAGSPAGSERVLQLGTTALERYGAFDTDWTERDAVQRLPRVERERLQSEIGELGFLTARAAAILRRDDDLAARMNAIALDTSDNSTKQAALQQRSHLSGVPTGEIARAIADGGRGDFLRACDLAFRGRFIDALPIANGYASTHPDDFGAWFLTARCHDVLGRYEEARAAYSTCSALRPRSAAVLTARGQLEYRQGRDAKNALQDLNRAIDLQPTLMEAHFTRSLVLHNLGQHAQSLAELDELAKNPNAPTRVYYARALVRQSLGDQAGADADRARVLSLQPHDPASFVTRGLLREKTEPEKALEDYRAAEKLDPFYPDALVNQASVLGERLNRTIDAIDAADRLLAIYPDHPNVQSGRAVLLARMGQVDKAVADANRMLARNPHPSVLYQMACVFAVASKTKKEYREDAIKYLSLSLLAGFGHKDLVDEDPDLASLRSDTRFQKLFDGAKIMREFESDR